MSAPRKVGDLWIYRFELPPDPDTGRRRQKRVSARTKAACYALEREEIARVLRGERTPGRQTLDHYLTTWLDQVVRITHRKQSTYHNYATWIRLHVRPQLGDILLSRLSPEHCEEWIADLVAAGCAPKSIRNYAGALGAALAHAERTGRIAQQPLRGIELPPLRPVERTIWTPAEALRFLAVAEQDVYHPFWLLAMTTGMRKGELLALRWSDVDLTTGRLVVRRAYYPPNGAEDDPKSPAGTRGLYLDPRTLEQLRAHQAAQQEQRRLLTARFFADDDLICTNAAGERIGYSTITMHMPVLCRRAAVPRLSPHGLRHVHITRLLDAGHDIALVASRVGHADVRTTRGVYYTIEDHAQRRLAAGVRDAVLGEPDEADPPQSVKDS